MNLDLFIRLAAQFGVPTVIAIGFLYWFFMKHLPAIREETQKRFAEMKEDHTKALELQERTMEKQGELFKQALSQIVDRMTSGFDELKRAIERIQEKCEKGEGLEVLKKAIERIQEKFEHAESERRKQTTTTHE